MQTFSPLPRMPGLVWVIALSLSVGGCAASERPAQPRPAQTGPAQADRADTGTIEGYLQHPAHAIPAMRVCAIGSGQPAPRFCVTTHRAQGRYRIEGLPADDYIVIAAAQDSLYPVGGHVQQVQCIRAPCPQMPATVTVTAGSRVAGIDINGFYERRDDFPAVVFDE